MALFEWSADYQVGITEIDTQHKKLVALINGLHEAMGHGKANKMLAQLFDELIAYTQSHFATEEALMLKYAYPGQKHHFAEHAALTQKAVDLQTKFNSGNVLVSFETSEFLRGWLAHHIQGIDMQLAQFLATKGVK